MTDGRDVTFSVEPIRDVDELGQEWRQLESTVRTSFFLSWTWIGTMLEMLDPDNRPMLVRGTAAGRTVALAVVGRARIRRHRLVRCRQWVLNATGDPALDSVYIEYNGLLTSPDVGWNGLLELFSATDGVDELSIPGAQNPPPAALIAEHGLLHHVAQERAFSVALRDLAEAQGDVSAVLSSNARSQLRRSLRRLEPLSLDAAASESEAVDLLTELKALHIPWWERRGERHAFVHPGFERFHRCLIERGFDEGAIQLLRVRSADRTIGVLYNFQRSAHVYAYQSGFAEVQANERPGVVAHALAIRRAWQAGSEVYDFMAGENRMKRSFANCTEDLHWVVVQKPHLRIRAEHLARRLKAQYASTDDAAEANP
ncbi:GNAT family N-acetyltransferase [Mycolicibacterium baixiangningiae]|uniref:GNAT family N-acetyltransferase n=1 Tax=Mycolicibacterium baixiangningiae TaxID=2761578 RepID=UPI0018D126D8|nr:GNAT family N-acetyltransferase [Mycolicibacterium baixiangningiae]